MSDSALLGVIDLRGGQAVHAVAGRRAAYRPLSNDACPDGDPVKLAEHYQRLGVAGLYVADLDRIVDRRDTSRAALAKLLRPDLPTWIDLGIREASDHAAAEAWRRELAPSAGEIVWIVATETIRSLQEIVTITARDSAAGVAVSLDLRDGQLVAAAAELVDQSPVEVAEAVVAAGANKLIVLDVARVGTAAGPTTGPLCRQLRRMFPEVEIASGGGVRHRTDAERLRTAGCDRVLAGTYLHALQVPD